MPSLNEERQGVSLCIVQDRFLYAIGSVFSRSSRHALKDTTKGAGQGPVEFSLERLDLTKQECWTRWDVISVEAQGIKPKLLPTMFNMGAFSKQTDSTKLILFGGGSGQPSDLAYEVDLKGKRVTILEDCKLQKGDRFSNQLILRKGPTIYTFGEYFLHSIEVVGDSDWRSEALPLN